MVPTNRLTRRMALAGGLLLPVVAGAARADQSRNPPIRIVVPARTNYNSTRSNKSYKPGLAIAAVGLVPPDLTSFFNGETTARGEGDNARGVIRFACPASFGAGQGFNIRLTNLDRAVAALLSDLRADSPREGTELVFWITVGRAVHELVLPMSQLFDDPARLVTNRFFLAGFRGAAGDAGEIEAFFALPTGPDRPIPPPVAMEGEPVPGVEVGLGQDPGGLRVSGRTDRSGVTTFVNLAPGRYQPVLPQPGQITQPLVLVVQVQGREPIVSDPILPAPAEAKKSNQGYISAKGGGALVLDVPAGSPPIRVWVQAYRPGTENRGQ